MGRLVPRGLMCSCKNRFAVLYGYPIPALRGAEVYRIPRGVTVRGAWVDKVWFILLMGLVNVFLVAAVVAELVEVVAEEHIVLRINGCPNGCGRTMLAGIGLVGKAPDRYNLYIGGNREGTRIPRLYRENITTADSLQELETLISRWAKERQNNEAFGDYAIRAGIVQAVTDAPRDFWQTA